MNIQKKRAKKWQRKTKNIRVESTRIYITIKKRLCKRHVRPFTQTVRIMLSDWKRKRHTNVHQSCSKQKKKKKMQTKKEGRTMHSMFVTAEMAAKSSTPNYPKFLNKNFEIETSKITILATHTHTHTRIDLISWLTDGEQHDDPLMTTQTWRCV